eukprot:SAG22_NODE_638_length_8262_cov_4.658826_8_plen_155_part_00
MDKNGLEKVRKQWEALKEFQGKVKEIAQEKVQLAEQAQRHITNHMARLDKDYASFEKDLGKSDPEGLAEVQESRGAAAAAAPAPPPSRKRQKQPTKFDLVGKWIAIEYDDEDQSMVVRDWRPSDDPSLSLSPPASSCLLADSEHVRPFRAAVGW